MLLPHNILLLLECSCWSSPGSKDTFALQVLTAIATQHKLSKPSASYGASNLYMQGPLEQMTRSNLEKVGHSRALSEPLVCKKEQPLPPVQSIIACAVLCYLCRTAKQFCAAACTRLSPSLVVLQPISELVDGSGSLLQINDKSLVSTLRVKLIFTGKQADETMTNGP